MFFVDDVMLMRPWMELMQIWAIEANIKISSVYTRLGKTEHMECNSNNERDTIEDVVPLDGKELPSSEFFVP